nr:hypothetical protein [Leptolyngbyaceae cyanobacterium MO_188.B28]
MAKKFFSISKTFLKDILEDPTRSNCHHIAADSLASTYLPKAADALANHYGKLEAVRAPLIKMGDLAVSALRKLGQIDNAQTKEKILDDLFKIGTPDAAIALTSFIWADDLFAARAA